MLLGVLLCCVLTAALFWAVSRWTDASRSVEGGSTDLVSMFGLDSAAASRLTSNVPSMGTRTLASVLASGSNALVAAGAPDPRIVRSAGPVIARVNALNVRAGRGGLTVPLLASAAEGIDSSDVRVELDSAEVMEISYTDLSRHADSLQLGALRHRDSAVIVVRVIVARLALSITRRDGISRAAWVRDSARAARKAEQAGVRLVLTRSSRNGHEYRTPDRVVIAYEAVPLCTIADCRVPVEERPRPPPVISAPAADAGSARGRGGTPRDAQRPELVPVHVFTSPPNAQIRVAGVERGTQRTIRIAPGEYRFEAFAPGYHPATEVVEVSRETTVSLILVRQ